MGNTAGVRMKADAALETSQPYFIGSMKIRRLLGITAFDTTISLARVWRRLGCGCDGVKLQQAKSAQLLRNQLKISKRDSEFCNYIVELILGSATSSGKESQRQKTAASAFETLEESPAPPDACSCFPVFVAWAWLFATATTDVLGLMAFRLFDDRERLGYVTTDGDVESILRFLAGNTPFEHMPDIVIRNRSWIRSSFSVDPVLNGGMPAVNEDRFVVLVERFDRAGYLHRLHSVQHQFRKMFGRKFWTPEKLDFAQSQLKKPAFKDRLLHLTATQCACLTATCEAAVSFADISIMKKESTSVEGLENAASKLSMSSFALGHTVVNSNPLCCVVAPKFQYLLQLGGVPFEARVDGAGHTTSPKTRRHVSFQLRCFVDSSRNVVNKYTPQREASEKLLPAVLLKETVGQASPRESTASASGVMMVADGGA